MKHTYPDEYRMMSSTRRIQYHQEKIKELLGKAANTEGDQHSTFTLWVAAFVRTGGLSQTTTLHAHYADWCSRAALPPLGVKSFSQALRAAVAGTGIVKRKSGSKEWTCSVVIPERLKLSKSLAV